MRSRVIFWILQALLLAITSLVLFSLGMVIFSRMAEAGGYERVYVIHDAKPTDAWFARIVIENHEGSTDGGYVIETEAGTVEGYYHTTSNQPCAWHRDFDGPAPPEYCADTFEITSLPVGVIARPLEITLNEETTGEIYLFRWQGG